MRAVLVAAMLVVGACAAGGGPPASPPRGAAAPAPPSAGIAEAVDAGPLAGATPAASPAPAPLTVPPPVGDRIQPIRTPRALYELCHDRLELPEAPGECAADADCAKAGCSGEVCVTAKAAADIATTCDYADCFTVLDTCGCVAGVCAWTLKMPGAAPAP